ncbi:MAG: VOC family protein [Solirubrobacterales bacterium]
MSERSSYAPGIASWVELSGTPDVDASEAFYREVFGWEVPELPSSAEMGGYRRAKLGGRDVAGVSPRMQDGQPTVWATYVSVADAAAAIAKVREAGGQVIVEPMDVMDLGTMAVFADSTGAVCGIWQPGTFIGAELVNEPGAFCWNELETRDPAASKAFYGAVFGWEFDDHDMGEMGTYTEWKLGGEPIGGMVDITGRVPEEIPDHWMVYFAVADADAALAKVGAAGGSVMFGPVDIPAGRFAIASDPHGAAFAVIKLSAEG